MDADAPAAAAASHRPPIVPDWLRHYRHSWLRADLVAGLIVGSVVVPQCVAYAEIAGLPPQATLAAIVVVAIASFFRVDELRRFARVGRSAIVLARPPSRACSCSAFSRA